VSIPKKETGPVAAGPASDSSAFNQFAPVNNSDLSIYIAQAPQLRTILAGGAA